MTEPGHTNKAVCRVANWITDRDSLGKIRRVVFIVEQNVPESMEWDEFDESSTHFLATVNDQAIACARLQADGKIGRMAVLDNYRSQGIGTALLSHVIDFARQQGMRKLYLYAQTSARAFYERHDFQARGNEFNEAGITHIKMTRELDWKP